MRAYYRRLTSDDPVVRANAARHWSMWEGATSFLRVNPDYVAKFEEDAFAEAFARIECHYFVNGGFLRSPSQLLDDVDKIRHIPGVIVQGRYDMVCPIAAADRLARAWSGAQYRVVPDAGHSSMEPGIRAALVKATEDFKLYR